MNGIELHAVKDAESIKAVEKKKYQKKEYSLALSFDYICDIFFIINLCCPEFNAEIIKHNFLIAILNSTILFPLSI